METLEKMSDFFEARVDGYDNHMLDDVPGCREAYQKMAELVPEGCQTLLDLGCGTGLELDEIFKRHPAVRVTGIDLTQAMLDTLQRKHPNRSMRLICGSYFDVAFEENDYDCAVSAQTLHHFSHEEKIQLYKKLFLALKKNAFYMECDYMVENQAEEDFYYAEKERIRKELGLGTEDFYHYDTPCTIHNQIAMLKQAGFSSVQKVFRVENTTILLARKE